MNETQQEPVDAPTDNLTAAQHPVIDTMEPVHHKNAKVVLAFVFIVLLSVIAGLSYLLLQETDPEVDSTVEVSTPTDAAPQEDAEIAEELDSVSATDPLSKDWLLVEASDYSIKVPDGWELVLQDNGVLILDCSDIDCYDVVDGQRAVVTEALGGRDGLTGLLVTVQPAGYSENDLTSGYEFMGLIGQNNRFSHYQRVEDQEPTGQQLGEQPKGTVSNIIVDTLFDERIAYLSYDVLVGQVDPIDTIVEMLNTFTPSEKESTL